MTIEFAICDEAGKPSKDWLDLCVEMSEDLVIPKMFVSGLKDSAVTQCSNPVELGLNVEGIGELVSILLDLKG